jgi:O-antigen/teichoic acid export membrane protein
MLTEKEKKRLKKYEEDLAMPKWKFILGYGLSFGIITFILSTVADYFLDNDNFHWSYRLLITGIGRIVLSGFLFGWVMRKFVKYYYKQLKSD